MKNKKKILVIVAIVLMTLSWILFGLIFLVPFMPLSIGQKAIVLPILIGSAEVTWWVGLAIVGKQAVSKFWKMVNPKNCMKSQKDTTNNSEIIDNTEIANNSEITMTAESFDLFEITESDKNDQ